ncbi:MAG: trypsin-like serine protease, partial [Bdellovibrio sp.]|nr:trypsin-like serine protease [Bdellovibrio sp.]
ASTVFIKYGSHSCTGTVWAPHLILTAAHCAEEAPEKITVEFKNAHKKYRISDKYVHDEWAPMSPAIRRHDLALLYFKEALPKGYRPAERLQDFSVLKIGMPAKLVGYGINNEILKLGSGTLRETTVTIADLGFSYNAVLFDHTKGSGSCYGDSGGPAFYMKNGRPLIFAVTSAVISRTNGPTKSCKERSLYIRLDEYQDFLADAEEALLENVR